MAGKFGIRLLDRVGQEFFRAYDEFARQHGWQLTVSRFGLSRVYRDARFDLLAKRDDHGADRTAAASRVQTR